MMANILIIDDERMFCDLLTRVVHRTGHDSSFCLTLEDGLKEAFRHPYDLVLLDVQLPDGNGLEAIDKIRRSPSNPEVIILTGLANPDGAESAIRWGAWDYIEKPATTGEITLPLLRALEYREEKLTVQKPIALNRKKIIGNSPALARCLDLLAKSSKTDVNVLITGETGTGKELFAQTLHENSARAGKPFVIVDCSALPESLVESVLFGHEKGAFTGAERSQTGLVKLADGGTLFLDEVGELPLPMQKTFLRVLQEHRFRPVGAKAEVTSNFRLIAATNRTLDEMVQSGTFRSDLLYRLRSVVIELPSLRSHSEDIKDLAIHHVTRFCDKNGITLKGFSQDFFDTLTRYEWPGNVRELFGTIQSAIATAGSAPVLYPAHLPVQVRAKLARSSIKQKKTSTSAIHLLHIENDSSTPISPYREYREKLLDNAERFYFSSVARQAAGDIKRACSLTSLSRSRLYYFLQKYNISILAPHETHTPENQDQNVLKTRKSSSSME